VFKKTIRTLERDEPASALELRVRQDYPQMREVLRRLARALKTSKQPVFKDHAEAAMFCLRVAACPLVPQKVLRLAYLLDTLLPAFDQGISGDGS
jgi:hypothetical protein